MRIERAGYQEGGGRRCKWGILFVEYCDTRLRSRLATLTLWRSIRGPAVTAHHTGCTHPLCSPVDHFSATPFHALVTTRSSTAQSPPPPPRSLSHLPPSTPHSSPLFSLHLSLLRRRHVRCFSHPYRLSTARRRSQGQRIHPAVLSRHAQRSEGGHHAGGAGTALRRPPGGYQ